MKLPVLFFSSEAPKLEKYDVKHVTPEESKTFDLYNTLNTFKPVAIITIGKPWQIYGKVGSLNYHWRRRWLHFDDIKDFKPSAIEGCYATSALDRNNHTQEWPYVSVITTAFHSGDKIYRPFKSLQKQSYTNWEWIIFDDSKTDENWELLKKIKAQDYRIKLYRSDANSGFIGHVKRCASMLAVGKYLVELDHDDELHPDMLKWIVDGFRKFPEAKFLWSDCCELYEGTLENFNYGDHFAYGYGSNYRVKHGEKYREVTVNPWPNAKSMRHIVGVPNHVRVWETEFYQQIGMHNPHLPVADDYELLVRTFLKTKFIHVTELGYFQYRNQGGNNFTFLRNQLIQELTYLFRMQYDDKIHERLLELGIGDEVAEKGWLSNPQAWLDDTDNKMRCERELIYKPRSTEVSLILVFNGHMSETMDIIRSVIHQSYDKWELFVIGSGKNRLDEVMDILLFEVDDRVRWWNLKDKVPEKIMNQYARKMLVSTEKVIRIKNTLKKSYLSEFMKEEGGISTETPKESKQEEGPVDGSQLIQVPKELSSDEE